MVEIEKVQGVINMKKGQAAVETITLIGFVILFSIPLLMLLTSLNTEDSAILQAKTSTQILADTANSVYIQGPNAYKIISIGFPDKLKNITFDSPSVGESEIIFTLDTDAGQVDIVAITIAPIDINSNITGLGGFNTGLQKVKVEYGTGEIKFTAIQ